MSSQNSEKDIVYIYSKIFEILKWISLFEVLRFYLKKRRRYIVSSRFVELWVVGHLALSFISVNLAYLCRENRWILYPLIIYGFLRTIEIVIYQVNVLLFDQYRVERSGGEYRVKGYRRMVILLFHNFFEIIFWFSVTYMYSLNFFKIENEIPNNVVQSVYISFVTMTTFGAPNFNIKDSFSLYLISIQSFIGLIMTLLTFARFISLLPDVKSRSEG